MRTHYFAVPVWLLFSSLSGAAQPIEEIKKTYSGAEIIYLKYNKAVTISLVAGEPVAESRYEKELLVLSEKNANVYSRHSVYHSSYNELKSLEAYTMVPTEGGKYKKLKVTEMKTGSSTSNSVFYDDVKQTDFNFPGLAPGAIEHVEYTQYNKDCHLLMPYSLPGYLPVVSASFTLTVPNSVDIRHLVRNDDQNVFTLKVDKKRQETIYTWTAANIKPLNDYADAPDDSYYTPHIVYHITSFEGNNGRQKFLSNVDDLYNWNASFTKDLNTTPDATLQAIVDSLTKGLATETAKAKKIYKWVQANIKYVAFEQGIEGFRPRQAAEVCSKRYGDCKDMSSIITQMLRLAGIKAYYTWIGTRSLPYTYTETPLPIVDNHMISTAFIENEWIFLDGTDPHAKYGMHPSSIQGKEALVGISPSVYKILTVPVMGPEKTVLTDSTFISFGNEGIKGKEKVHYSGYFGEDVYNSLLYKDERSLKDYIKTRMGKASNKFILGEYSIDKKAASENEIDIHAGFEVPDYGKKMGNEYYINLNLEKLLENRLIDTAKRKVPIENEFNYEIRQYHILEIPAGYGVTYQPKNFNFQNDLIGISIAYKQQGNQIIATQVVTNKKLLIYPAEFVEWNKAMKAVAPHYKEQVVLEKK
ncbi:MAG: DUF3857 domain-containing protein [Bacteroidetes bacterium]|nr:MAG: DUF3857 domain-containing protein [Bacteroidota bacterium]